MIIIPDKVQVARVDPGLPVAVNKDPQGNAGWDLIATETITLPAMIAWATAEQIRKVQAPPWMATEESLTNYPIDLPVDAPMMKVPANIKVAIPTGYWGLVKGRSGNDLRGLRVADGTIDAGYRGQIFVTVQNLTAKNIVIERGERIAQLIIQPCLVWEPEEVDALDETDRGESGFGASGRF